MSVTSSADTDISADNGAGPGMWAAVATMVRLIVGWASVAIGALNLIVEFDRPSGAADGPYLLFHTVWLVGGVVLLALAWFDPHPSVAEYVAGGVVTLAGTIISALPATTTVCCVSAYSIRHGYPFTFLAHNEGAGAAGRWHVDGPHALADLMFWAFLGLVALIAVSQLRGTPERIAIEIPQLAADEERQYIEHHDHAAERAPHKTVGPLP